LSRDGATLVTASVSVSDGLLTFYAEHPCLSSSATVVDMRMRETPQLWHRRLKHAHVDVLARMQKEGLVTCVSVSAEEFRAAKNTVCEPCQAGKQTHCLPAALTPSPQVKLCAPIGLASSWLVIYRLGSVSMVLCNQTTAG
jgi:hypothetical protein